MPYLLGQNCLQPKNLRREVKDAMPVSFRSELFTSYILTMIKQQNLLPSIWETAKLIIHACKNITEKNAFIENVWTANLALFIYVSTHFVETVKWLDYNRYSQLTWWCSGNASALGARGPGFNPWLQQGFLCLIFCFVAVMFLLFYPKTHYLSQKFAILFTMLIYLVYLTYCKICDWL